MSEVVLPRRVIPQPSPFMVQGGDCGACVLGGIFGLSVPETYERFITSRFGKLQSFCWENIVDALNDAERKGLADRAVVQVPIWPIDTQWMTWGLVGANQYFAWQAYLRMAFDAGYYAIAGISIDGKGAAAYGPDRWVLLCGWRPSPEGTVLDEILVSCSARHPEGRWVKSRDFLQQQGGYNVLLARPAARR
jgi:hypothetical protein